MIREGWKCWSRRLGVLGFVSLVWVVGRWLPSQASLLGLALAGIAALGLLERLRSQDLAHARQAERRRLAADLHDGVATSLASLSWGLSGLRRLARQGQPLEERATRLEHEVKDLAKELRGVVLELREPPRGLQQWSAELGGRLQALAQAQADARGVPSQPCRVHFSPTGDLGRNLAGGICSELERIVVEGVYNALRHAHCQ
ncbi:MAG: hypothetical protein KC492_42245, partial [Myxococcales bacterium]|nr:hypothetical protein [Myxococcales bacterium]